MKERIFQKQIDLQNTPFIPRNLKFDTDIMKLKKIVSLVGPRRSGKTTYMLQIIETLRNHGLLEWNQVVYIDFNDHIGGAYDFESLLQTYLSEFPESKPMFFFDEIQEVTNMRSGVFFLYNLGYQIFITGSNSKLLSTELSTHFRGKSFEIKIHTLDFSEYLDFVEAGDLAHTARTYKDQALLDKHFEEYIQMGAYPELALIHGNKVLQTQIVKTYMDIMIYKDLMERYSINNEYVLKYMIRKMIGSHAKQININKLNNELKSRGILVDKNLLYTILEHLHSVFFLNTLSQKFKKQGFKKVYVGENIYQTIYNNEENIGQKFENTIFQSLRRQYDHIYYSNASSGEIDFILPDHNIQVSRTLTDENIHREASLLQADDILIYMYDQRTCPQQLNCKLVRYDQYFL